MTRVSVLEPVFVTTVPRELEPGRLYISMEYGTVVHSCCCGCGSEVVTPLTPTDWSLTFDGEHISLWPSVGSWNLPCQSHYVIRKNRVVTAAPWSQKQIEGQIAKEKVVRAQRYDQANEQSASEPVTPADTDSAVSSVPEQRSGFWSRLWELLR